MSNIYEKLLKTVLSDIDFIVKICSRQDKIDFFNNLIDYLVVLVVEWEKEKEEEKKGSIINKLGVDSIKNQPE